MRTTRIVSALVALVVAISMSMAFTSPAATGAAKTRHDLVAKGKEIGNTNKFVTFGKVTTFKGRKITIQRKVNRGAFKFWKKTKTNATTGKFRERIYGGKRGSKVCYKIVVPSTKNYKTTRQFVGCITTF